MAMHRLFAFAAALALGVCLSAPAHADRSVITATAEGHDLRVVVHGVTDYCSTNARTEVIRRGDTIRIIRERPSRVSRCMDRRDVTVVVNNVPAGTYRVSYEQIPLVAPARALTLGTTTAVVTE
jgi:hypothetical protein